MMKLLSNFNFEYWPFSYQRLNTHNTAFIMDIDQTVYNWMATHSSFASHFVSQPSTNSPANEFSTLKFHYISHSICSVRVFFLLCLLFVDFYVFVHIHRHMHEHSLCKHTQKRKKERKNKWLWISRKHGRNGGNHGKNSSNKLKFEKRTSASTRKDILNKKGTNAIKTTRYPEKHTSNMKKKPDTFLWYWNWCGFWP